MASVGIITLAYIVLVALAGLFVAVGCWIPAVITALGALALTIRYELRWCLDHSPWAKVQTPRPIPREPVQRFRS